jgi:hypothetical protein
MVSEPVIYSYEIRVPDWGEKDEQDFVEFPSTSDDCADAVEEFMESHQRHYESDWEAVQPVTVLARRVGETVWRKFTAEGEYTLNFIVDELDESAEQETADD